MKPKHIPIAFLLLAATSCATRQPSDDIVCQTYVHRYGVPLEADDWSARGQHGQVVSTLKTGVTVANSYESGVLHGETTYTFPHRDTIQKKEQYQNGILTQESWYYQNGMPQKQVDYHPEGQRSVVNWYESGAPQAREIYHGECLARGEYFNPSNQQESLIEDRNGMRICRDGYGILQSHDEIRDGAMIVRTTYHPNGAPQSITPYVNNVEQGKRQTYLPGGEPHTIEEWNNGFQHGNTVVFENGEKYADVPYQGGTRQGVERRYRNGETLVEEVTWVNDKKQGPSYSYYGGAPKTTWYFGDREVNKATYDVLINE